MSGYQTLVLNADWNPISIFPLHSIPAEDAFTRVLNGTVEVVTEYDSYIKMSRLSSYQDTFKWPAVVVKVEMADWEKTLGLNHDSLYYRDHAVCSYCGIKLTLSKHKEHSITMDHVIPKSEGGRKDWDNIVAACSKCNELRGNAPATGIWTPRKKPYVPTYWGLVKARRKYPISVNHESWVQFLGEWDAPVKVKQLGV